MGVVIRIFFPAIGYFCVATVITLAAGYGYLRQTGTLDNETMFRIVSLVHGVDLGKIAADSQTDRQDVPPEEMSFEDRQQHTLMAVLHLQAKKDDIEKNITVFNDQSAELDSKFGHFEKFRNEVEHFLEVRKNEALDSGLLGVRDQWKNLDPKKQVKPLLVQMIDDDKMDVVIELLNSMPPNNRAEILKTFDSEDDVDMLYKIEQQMLNGGSEAAYINQKLQELKQEEN